MPSGTELVGWGSSIVLLATILRQVWTQWERGDSEGVSIWLFIGQLTASSGFTIYSALIGNWVFILTNALLAMSAVVGIVIVMTHRRRRAATGPRRTGDRLGRV